MLLTKGARELLALVEVLSLLGPAVSTQISGVRRHTASTLICPRRNGDGLVSQELPTHSGVVLSSSSLLGSGSYLLLLLRCLSGGRLFFGDLSFIGFGVDVLLALTLDAL